MTVNLKNKLCLSCWKKPAVYKIGKQLYCQACKDNRENAIKALKAKK